MATWDENTQLVRGNEFSLYLTQGKTVIAYATSCSLQVDSETIDTSSKFSCKWASNLGGNASYTISADALYCQNIGSGVSFDTLLKYMVAGEQVSWYMGEEQAYTGSTCADNPHTLDTGSTYYNGKAVITSVSLEAGNNEIASCSITLTGAGEIQINGAKIPELSEEEKGKL